MIKLTEEKTEPEYCWFCQEKKDIIEKGKIKQPNGLLSPFITYQCPKCKTKVKVRDLV